MNNFLILLPLLLSPPPMASTLQALYRPSSRCISRILVVSHSLRTPSLCRSIAITANQSSLHPSGGSSTPNREKPLANSPPIVIPAASAGVPSSNGASSSLYALLSSKYRFVLMFITLSYSFYFIFLVQNDTPRPIITEPTSRLCTSPSYRLSSPPSSKSKQSSHDTRELPSPLIKSLQPSLTHLRHPQQSHTSAPSSQAQHLPTFA
jgi:hypothetical protein